MADEAPIPDPTTLTTEQLLREVENTKTIVFARVKGVEDSCNDKFQNTKNQFSLIETQRVEQKKDTKDAVDAALTAQKDAVREQTKTTSEQIDKSERGMKEQINQLTNTLKTEIGAVSGTLSDVKDRVQRMEAINQGRQELRTDNRASISNNTTIVSSIIGVILFLLTISGLVYTITSSSRQPASPEIITVTTP